jgi:lipopolysaccharide transport system permease protein
VPAGSVMTSYVDFLIGCALLGLLLAYYRLAPAPTIVFLPFFVALVSVAALGLGLWVSALMVRYRDFKVIVHFMVQLGLYISPIGFTSAVVTRRFLPPEWGILYWLNPLAGIIDGFRWSILGGPGALYLPGLCLSLLVVATITVSGVWYFRKSEDGFADII